jgi:hypothetical protein
LFESLEYKKKVPTWKSFQVLPLKEVAVSANGIVVYYHALNVTDGNRNAIENSLVTIAASEGCRKNAGTKFPSKYGIS